MEIANGPLLYEVVELVREIEEFRLCLCIQKNTGRECLLQIATEAKYNGDLQRNVFILKELKRLSDELEMEYAKVKKDPKKLLNYHLGFPEVVDSFIFSGQDNRQVNILAFRNVERVNNLEPLIKLTEKDGLRVDLRTSAWILGKLLKLLVLTQSEKISVEPMLESANILIEPDQHYALIFDWSKAIIYDDAIDAEIRRIEISKAVRAVITALGGNLERNYFPDDGEKAFKPYTEYLLRLESGIIGKAKKAHEDFYQLVDSLWKREFYPFTTKPLERDE